MTFNDLTKTVVLLLRGEWRRVYNEVHVRIYRWIYEVIFFFVRPSRVRGRRTPPEAALSLPSPAQRMAVMTGRCPTGAATGMSGGEAAAID